MNQNQPTAKPTRKVSAAAVAGAFVILLRWLLTFGDVELPNEVGTAIATLIFAVGAAYMTQERDG